MWVVKGLATIIFWFSLWCAIPAVMLFPLALWAAKNTFFSVDSIAESYMIGVCLFFLPTAFLLDFLYRKARRWF
jgi:hypothetical protein